MNITTRERLLKVLALADSTHEGEAIAAVRVARQLLAQTGLSFADLARQALTARPTLDASATRVRMLEVQVTELQRRLQETQKQVQERNALLAAANTKLQQMEQQTGRVHGEVEHWRKLARDTANKLWEIGQQIAEDRDVSQKIAGKLQDIQPAVRSAARVSVAPVGLSRERRFVRNSLLEAQESSSPSTRSASQSK